MSRLAVRGGPPPALQSSLSQTQSLMDKTKLLLRASLLCAVTYLIVTTSAALLPDALTQRSLIVVLKGLSVSLLAVMAFRSLHGSHAGLLGGALALSSLGDIFLALRGGSFFLYGLGSFLLAHLVYIALFIRFRAELRTLSAAKKLLILLVGLYAAGMMWWLLPAASELAVPVALYMLVLTGMVLSVIRAKFASPLLIAGALLFMFSDSLIGISKFRGIFNPSLTAVLIWVTYYSAQYLLANGFIAEIHRNRQP